MQVFGQVLGHAFGQRGDKGAVAFGGDLADLVEEVVDLHLDGADLHLRVEKPGGADDLFGEDAARLFEFPALGGGGDEDGLGAHGVPFLELQGPVVHAGGQAEAVFGEREFAAVVAPVHAADLGDGDVAFIGEDDARCRGCIQKAWGAVRRGRGR